MAYITATELAWNPGKLWKLPCNIGKLSLVMVLLMLHHLYTQAATVGLLGFPVNGL